MAHATAAATININLGRTSSGDNRGQFLIFKCHNIIVLPVLMRSVSEIVLGQKIYKTNKEKMFSKMG